jgi:hypothetical protein
MNNILILYFLLLILILLILYKCYYKINNKTLIVYVYYENDLTKKNLEYFLNNGIENNNDYTYLLIINNYICSLDIPKNIYVIKKENSYDLEAYNEIFTYNKINIKNYKYFLFINSSCIGPFLPNYCNDWVKCFTNLLNSNIKLVGPIIENPGDGNGIKAFNNFHKTNKYYNFDVPFIHSYMFATDNIGLDILKKYKIFDKVNKHDDLIFNKERLLTSSILLNGYNIKSLLYKYKKFNINNNFFSDPEIPYNYDGIDVNPFEIIFVKNIRNTHNLRLLKNSGISNILDKYLSKYIEWNNIVYKT